MACGKRAADPHFTGTGSILVNKPIIIDIFPRLKTERYYADMTRTVVKGEPGKAIKEMYEAVLAAQNAALARVKEGVTCKALHNLVCDVLYDPEVRGVRLEDVVLVRRNGCENLTRFEKNLMI